MVADVNGGEPSKEIENFSQYDENNVKGVQRLKTKKKTGE